ncbi:hypothetical protein LXL04_028431 [Taraxacum kok-saghyz]
MFRSKVNNDPKGGEGGQVNLNNQDQFAFQTPQAILQPQVQLTQSARSSTSVARIEEMEEQIRVSDAQISQIQQVLRVAGLLPTGSGPLEDEAQSRSVPCETKMEQTFRSADFTEDQKVNYAVRMFEGEALAWWDSVDQLLTKATRMAMTWEIFNNKVKERYCSFGAMQRVEREFLALQKGTTSIAKYNTVFTEKLQFVRDYCPH